MRTCYSTRAVDGTGDGRLRQWKFDSGSNVPVGADDRDVQRNRRCRQQRLPHVHGDAGRHRERHAERRGPAGHDLHGCGHRHSQQLNVRSAFGRDGRHAGRVRLLSSQARSTRAHTAWRFSTSATKRLPSITPSRSPIPDREGDQPSLFEHMNRFDNPVPAGFRVSNGGVVTGEILELRRVHLVPASTYTSGRSHSELHGPGRGRKRQRPTGGIVLLDDASQAQGCGALRKGLGSGGRHGSDALSRRQGMLSKRPHARNRDRRQ